MSNHLSDYTGFEVRELITVLPTPLGTSSHLKDELLRRDPSEVVKCFKDLKDDFEKTLLANLIVEKWSHFKEFIDLEEVKLFSNSGVVPSVKRGLRGDLSVGVEPGDDGYDGKVSLTDEFP